VLADPVRDARHVVVKDDAPVVRGLDEDAEVVH
jgi:hypothetical protein